MSETEGTEIVIETSRRRRFILTLCLIFTLCVAGGYIAADRAIDNEGEATLSNVVINLGEPDSLPAPMARVARQTVVIRGIAESERQPVSLGTGFLVAKNIVLTAAHVVGELEVEQVIVYCSGEERVGDVLWNDRMRDIAVVIAVCPAEPLEIDSGRLDVDDQLTIAGFNFLALDSGERIIYRFAQSTSPIPGATLDPKGQYDDPFLKWQHAELLKRKIKPTSVHHALSGRIRHGNSGSPVFRPNGKLVGIGVVDDAPLGRAFMIPAASIVRALRESHARDFTDDE